MNVLAVVSKAIFEKQARVGGALVGVGDVWPTAQYLSGSPHLEPLAAGGDLYLVTVRPGDVLWLVAVLRAPRRAASGWSAAANTTPVVDVTAALPKLRFASGKGVSAEPGKLGMSLQTPRALTEADVALFGQAPGAAAGAVVSEASGLRLDRYRRRARWSKLTPAEKAALAPCEEEIKAEAQEFGGVELMDVIDEATGEVLYLFALWPFGSGVLVDRATHESVADVCQHGFEARGDKALRERMQVAFARAKERFKIAESVDFRPGRDEDRPKPPPDTTPLSDRVAALRRDVAAGKSVPSEAVAEVLGKVFDFKKYRPLPVRRPFELGPVEREALELVHEACERSIDLYGVGLPNHTGAFWLRAQPERDPGALARFLGHPRGALDETILVDGQPHPIWCLVSDALYDVRPRAEVMGLLAALPVEVRAAAWAELARDRSERLTGVPLDVKGAQRGSPAAIGALAERFVRLAVDLHAGLGEAGDGAARAILAEHAAWAATWGPKVEDNPKLAVPHTAELCIALAALARQARLAGGALDERHDATLSVLARSEHAGYTVVVALEELPRERAARIACAQLTLIPQFPAPLSAPAAVRLLAGYAARYQGSPGPWVEKVFRAAIKAIGAAARPSLVEALETLPSQRALLEACIAQLDARTKKPAKPR